MTKSLCTKHLNSHGAILQLHFSSHYVFSNHPFSTKKVSGRGIWWYTALADKLGIIPFSIRKQPFLYGSGTLSLSLSSWHWDLSVSNCSTYPILNKNKKVTQLQKLNYSLIMAIISKVLKFMRILWGKSGFSIYVTLAFPELKGYSASISYIFTFS